MIKHLGTHILNAVNEAYLFHRTKPSNIKPISENRQNNRLNANSLFGARIYSAENSTKTDQYAGNKLLKSKLAIVYGMCEAHLSVASVKVCIQWHTIATVLKLLKDA